MKPYVELAWSTSVVPYEDTDTELPFQVNSGFHVEAAQAKYLPKIMGVWSLENMTRNKENVKIIYQEGGCFTEFDCLVVSIVLVML